MLPSPTLPATLARVCWRCSVPRFAGRGRSGCSCCWLPGWSRRPRDARWWACWWAPGVAAVVSFHACCRFFSHHRWDVDRIGLVLARLIVDRLLDAGAPIVVVDITKNTMRAAFAAYASTHEPASIRRCWSTWNVLCDFLYTAELIAANPMPFVGRPKAAKTLPRSLPNLAVGRAARGGGGRPRAEAPHRLVRTRPGADSDRVCWPGCAPTSCAEPMSVISARPPVAVRSSVSAEKAARTAVVPIEADLLSVIEDYLDSRARRFPTTTEILGGTGAVPVGRGTRRYSSAATANGSPAAPCSRGWDPRVPAGRPRRPAGARCPRARAAPHLRHRAGQLRGQRVHADEAVGARVDGDITALRRRRRPRNPHRRRPKPALWNDSRSPPSVAHA